MARLYIYFGSTPQLSLVVGLLARLLQLLNSSQDPSGQVQISQESSFGKEHPRPLSQLLYQCSQQGHMTVVEKLLPVSKTTWNVYDSRFHAHCKCQSRCQPKAYPSRAGAKFQGQIYKSSTQRKAVSFQLTST